MTQESDVLAIQRWISQLSGCVLFQAISTAELSIMLQCLSPRVAEFRKNELIIRSGERFGGVGILLIGSGMVAKENLAGNRVIMDVLEPGALFGEMAAFTRENIWPATIIAQTPCTVMFLPVEKLISSCANLCNSHRQLTLNLIQIIAERALMLHRKVEYLVLGSLRKKIGQYLLEQLQNTGMQTFLLPMNRNELAEFLNTTRPSLSRELGRLRDEGIIEFHRAAIRVRNIEALQKLVDG
jgi:CRP/FNR family transcriptional regulator, dissimilatory nitrate respiration regulator